jgi:membrane protein insertase Oxa1/YidC/SpoIIIJ
MMFSMFVQQKVSMSTMSGSSSAEQQKLMAIFMPLIFGMLFYSMPAALVLYWFVYGVLSGAQQWLLMRSRRAE